MVCRENPASSIAIALARMGSWLDDAQLQSIVHRLRHEFDGHAPPVGYDRAVFIDRTLARSGEQIRNHPNLGVQRRQGMTRRLERAREQTDAVRDDILWALSRLPEGVQASQHALDARLVEIAGHRGMSIREARAELIQLRAAAPAGRQPRANAEEVRDLGVIPSDPATRHALREMTGRPPLVPPLRLVDRWVPVAGTAPTPGAQVTRIGWSHLSDRVELGHGDGSATAYRVPPYALEDLEDSFIDGELDQASVAQVTAIGETIPRVEQTAYSLRCDDCGRFVGDRWHTCPGHRTTATTFDIPHRVNTSTISMAGAHHLALLVEQDTRPVAARVVWSGTGDDAATVTGAVVVRPGLLAVRSLDRTSRQLIDIDDTGGTSATGPQADELHCEQCDALDCRHVGLAREGIRDLLATAGPAPDDISERHYSRILTRPRPAQPAAPPAAQPDPATPTPPRAVPSLSFADSAEAFRQIVRESEQQVPFLPDGHLDGLRGGTRFGIELEFSTDDDDTAARIRQRLTADGLTPTSHHGSYHTAGRTGYHHWTMEDDSSLHNGGELVTPILSDDPDHWRQLHTACAAIRELGGTTYHAGSHTNISADGYTPGTAWRLTQMIRAYEDDIYRMGRTRRSPRDGRYSAPFPDPGPRWEATHQAARAQAVRTRMVNFGNTFVGARPRIEFRFPDASFDPGTIQAQVNLCAALTNHARTDTDPPHTGHQPLHSARRGGWARNLMALGTTDFARHTERVRTLIDTLFDDTDQRRQAAALWGRGSYYR